MEGQSSCSDLHYIVALNCTTSQRNWRREREGGKGTGGRGREREGGKGTEGRKREGGQRGEGEGGSGREESIL